MVRLRLAAGRRHKADAGGYAYGAPPFGYRSEGGRLVPRAEEQGALALITEMQRAQLAAGETSVRAIAAALRRVERRCGTRRWWRASSAGCRRRSLNRQAAKGSNN